jgi:predicted pyridoxine 5'-phosphate oxidase superfamily flavin-nucleotide-binding protein
MEHDVFHEGELAVQALAGEREAADRNGALVGPTIVAGALPFLSRQSLLAASCVDDDGEVWCSAWCGAPGFAASPDASTVILTRALDRTPADDPVRRCVRTGTELGLLAIELGTRRRLRINGTVERVNEAIIELAVRESFPNCPKYIQKRRLLAVDAPAGAAPPQSGTRIDDARAAFARRVDTMFVGSRHPQRGLDASHRGGAPGFLRLLDEQTMRVPDYPGNGMFQTLGNLVVDPRAGVVLVDFEGGRLLAMTGTVVLRQGSEDPAQPTGGTARYWDLAVQRWREYALPSSFRWELLERSPFLPSSPATV